MFYCLGNRAKKANSRGRKLNPALRRPGKGSRTRHQTAHPNNITRMTTGTYQDIKTSLRQLYLDDERPWLVGFSGGKDSTMLAALVFDAVLAVPPDKRGKPILVVCTYT